MATATVREHRLAAGYAIVIPSSLAVGLLLAGPPPSIPRGRARSGPRLCSHGSTPCAALARRGGPHAPTDGAASSAASIPSLLAFHARRGGLPVTPMLALQLVPILLLAGYWTTLSLRVLFAA